MYRGGYPVYPIHVMIDLNARCLPWPEFYPYDVGCGDGRAVRSVIKGDHQIATNTNAGTVGASDAKPKLLPRATATDFDKPFVPLCQKRRGRCRGRKVFERKGC